MGGSDPHPQAVRMLYNLSVRSASLFLLMIGTGGAQPVIGVWNSASSDPFGNLAPGTVVRIQLQNAPFLFAFDPSDVAVRFQADSDAIPRNLKLTYVSPSNWLEALLATDVPLGAAILTLVFSGQTSRPFAIQVVESRFGLYAVNSGVGPVKAAINGQLLGLTNPAHPGDEVTLQGTGRGVASLESMSVLLAGHKVPVSGVYAGNSPGIDEVRFVVPEDPGIPEGCYVQISVSIGVNTSNAGSIPTARSGSACAHPFGLGLEEMRLLDSGGQLILGTAAISSTITILPQGGNLSRVETVSALYLHYNAVNVALAAPALVADDRRLGCSVDEFRFGSSEGFFGNAFNVGDSVTLTGNGNTIQLAGRPPFFSYAVLVSREGPVTSPDQFTESIFSPGVWQLSTSGSDAVSPIFAQIQLPPQPRLLDFSSLRVIDRTQDLRVAWDPKGYTSTDTIDLMLSSGVASPGSGFSSTLHDVRCRVAAADGGVIIPASSMQVLAPDSTARLQVGIASGQRVVTSTPMVGAGVVRTLLGFNFDRGFRVSVQ